MLRRVERILYPREGRGGMVCRSLLLPRNSEVVDWMIVGEMDEERVGVRQVGGDLAGSIIIIVPRVPFMIP
jgi:hypothetical protein